MGICSSNRTASQHIEVVNPSNDDHAAIEAQYGGLLDPTHANNLNLKYDYLYKMIPAATIGEGIKKTCGYSSTVPQSVLLRKRKEFWETRVEGNTETWNALQIACEGDEVETSLAILNAAGIKLIQKSLQMSYDSHGYRYDIPIFVINLPTKYDENNKPKVAKKIMKKDIVLKIRCKTSETPVEVSTTDTVAVAMMKFRSHQKQVKVDETLRFFFSGREMLKDKQIGCYVNADSVIIGFSRKNKLG